MHENDKTPAGNRLDEDQLQAKYNESIKEKNMMFPKLATDHPEWKWIIRWDSWRMLIDHYVKEQYSNPGRFGM